MPKILFLFHSEGVELLRWRLVSSAGDGYTLACAKLSIPAVPNLTDEKHPWCLLKLRGNGKPLEVLGNYRRMRDALIAFERHETAHLGL